MQTIAQIFNNLCELYLVYAALHIIPTFLPVSLLIPALCPSGPVSKIVGSRVVEFSLSSLLNIATKQLRFFESTSLRILALIPNRCAPEFRWNTVQCVFVGGWIVSQRTFGSRFLHTRRRR